MTFYCANRPGGDFFVAAWHGSGVEIRQVAIDGRVKKIWDVDADDWHREIVEAIKREGLPLPPAPVKGSYWTPAARAQNGQARRGYPPLAASVR